MQISCSNIYLDNDVSYSVGNRARLELISDDIDTLYLMEGFKRIVDSLSFNQFRHDSAAVAAMEVLGKFVNVYTVFNMLNMQSASLANRFNSTPLVGLSDPPIANNLSLTDILDFTPNVLAPVDNHYQEPVENTEEVSENLDVPNQHPHYTIEMEASICGKPYLLDNVGHK